MVLDVTQGSLDLLQLGPFIEQRGLGLLLGISQFPLVLLVLLGPLVLLVLLGPLVLLVLLSLLVFFVLLLAFPCYRQSS